MVVAPPLVEAAAKGAITDSVLICFQDVLMLVLIACIPKLWYHAGTAFFLVTGVGMKHSFQYRCE